MFCNTAMKKRLIRWPVTLFYCDHLNIATIQSIISHLILFLLLFIYFLHPLSFLCILFSFLHGIVILHSAHFHEFFYPCSPLQYPSSYLPSTPPLQLSQAVRMCSVHSHIQSCSFSPRQRCYEYWMRAPRFSCCMPRGKMLAVSLSPSFNLSSHYVIQGIGGGWFFFII